jgi:hypothetical protein
MSPTSLVGPLNQPQEERAMRLMPGTPLHPSFEVSIADGGMILIKQTDGVRDDRPVVAIHPHDLADLIERLSDVGKNRPEPDEPST